MSARVLSVVLVAAASATACGNSGGSGNSQAAVMVDGGKVFCDQQYKANPPKAMPFSAGMSMTSKSYKVALVPDPPAPVPGDYSTWTLTVTDTSGNPVPAGTTVKVNCVMAHPGFSHPCPIPIKVMEMGGGVYKATPIVFNMPGNWVVDFKIADMEDVEFPLCIS